MDDTSFYKRYGCVTIVSDPKTGHVLHVNEGRTKSSLQAWYAGLTLAQLEQIESVSMDMWPAYIQSTLACVPGAKEKIAFDRFHVAKYLGEAVAKVRRQENRERMKQGMYDPKGTKYDWRTNPTNMSERQKERFQALRKSTLRTARAWVIKEVDQKLWHEDWIYIQMKSEIDLFHQKR